MPHQAPQANSFETSRFCQQLRSLANAKGSTTTLKNLSTATERFVSRAEAISDQIVCHLPQFTLHNGTHLWNVLSFMEELAGGEEEITKLDAGDCAMAVWAAFIHDLGMVLEASELAALDAADHYDTSADVQNRPPIWSDQRVQDWRAYRDGHEHWRAIRKDPQSAKSRMKLGIIRAAFIRESHASQDSHSGQCRIADWLGLLAKDDRLIAQALEDYSLDERIIRVAVSHSQDVAWLPRQLSAVIGGDPHAEYLGTDLDTIHWTWIGWLLRLADVFDCDASRTPRILFDHSGITDHRSRTEWQKHLAIRGTPTWCSGHDQETLLYTCHLCPSHIVEKAIHQITGWMNDEIAKCRAAWNALPAETRKGITLALPSEAKADIKKRQGDYLYEDIEFRLDRDAVVELLMGESLYGSPELALRELVQNSLDAVHLRDQRNKLAIVLEKAGSKEKARQPHKPWGATSGEVNVTWGTEPDGRSWIRVQDNGVGMTVGTMRRFLTQIGKSYYKSDDFHAEQEFMRRHGILCTAISQFGIGFLSVFMLADHVEIHTRPVGATDHPDKTKTNWQETERFPFRADIHGPHGLVALYPTDVRQTGTTVTLWLKGNFVLHECERQQVVKRLRWEFGYHSWDETEIHQDEREESRLKSLFSSEKSQGKFVFDPAFEIARLVLWPQHPVILRSTQFRIVVDQAFHMRELLPLNQALMHKREEYLGERIPEIDDCDWQACDWTDLSLGTTGATGTGTRIRLVGPQPRGAPNHPVSLDSWLSLPNLLESGKARLLLGKCAAFHAREPHLYRCLVNGIRVTAYDAYNHVRNADSYLASILEGIPMVPSAGAWMWIDLCGAAAPRLNAARSAPISAQSPSWHLRPIMDRWLKCWGSESPNWVRCLVHFRPLTSRFHSIRQSNYRLCAPGGGLPAQLDALIREIFTLDEFRHAVSNRVGLDGTMRDPLLKMRALTDWPSLGQLAGESWRHLTRVIEFAGQLAMTLAREANWKRDLQGICQPAIQMANRSSLYPLQTPKSAWFSNLYFHPISETLWPTLGASHPALGWNASYNRLADYHLSGPIHVSDQSPRIDWMANYDVVGPYTAFATGRLREFCSDWMADRSWRAISMLPLLLGTASPEIASVVMPIVRQKTLMLFMPNPDHYERLFAEHTQEEWAQGSASVLWDLEIGQVLYADGIHTEASLRVAGKLLQEWLGSS